MGEIRVADKVCLNTLSAEMDEIEVWSLSPNVVIKLHIAWFHDGINNSASKHISLHSTIVSLHVFL